MWRRAAPWPHLPASSAARLRPHLPDLIASTCCHLSPLPFLLSLQADRAGKLTELEALKAEREALAAQLKAYADSDPDAYKALLAKVGGAKAGADRWTDNVFTAKSYLINKFGKEPREVDAMLGLKDDFDYVK